MLNSFSRTELLLGKEAMNKLKNSTVAVFGVGGVGSFAAEGIARCGVGKIILIDNDDISITNINRQIHSTTKTIGKPKVEVMAERIREINPEAEVIPIKNFFTSENAEELLKREYSYVVDAIDTVSAKIHLIYMCDKMGIPIMSSMGAGNKLDPTRFEVTDIYKTSVCPLAKVMRYELKKRGVKKLKVVYSKEEPVKPKNEALQEYKENKEKAPELEITTVSKRQTPGSISFVPSVAGLIIAGEVIKDLIK
ncbi:thiamine biosynthesis protein ThiF [Fervidicella metallireducens AeB]|uniref:Thiamine biosynthesis protein ThiF n=1 Tax=Fervidicella metallireducens AeB TaxID=1403537 RepID=A0A017RXZ9_9CLOT|nr:tRNA threonylcarbamoyladenosine dehydratase [Fervidicella metallireducens]EYE89638.1 thiamine biosynthesis protein ThiF [Fervidicella metallireducens AeB]